MHEQQQHKPATQPGDNPSNGEVCINKFNPVIFHF